MATQQTTLGETTRDPEHRHVDGILQLSRPPTDTELRWGITGPELRRRHRKAATPQQATERRCRQCGLRVTQTSEGWEAGHAAGYRGEICPLHPDAEDRDESLE